MLNLSYYMPVEIIYGDHCVSSHSEIFRSMGKSCLIVTGKHSAKASGALDDVIKVLEQEHILYQVFDEVEQNPLVSTCQRAGKMARDMDADFVIGIGGGSPLDAAKAVAVFGADDLTSEELYAGNYSKAPLPFVLIGTTAGTGSEVTPYSVLIEDHTGRKRSVKNLFAQYCFCDWNYTKSLDYHFTVSTALDALSHCIEGYFCTKADTMSDVFALNGIRLVMEVLSDLAPDRMITDRQRQKLYAGSIYGGLTIVRTGTSYCHAMGYFLSEDYGVSHGTACAVFLPDYLKRGCSADVKKGDRLMFEIDSSLSEICSLIENLTDFTPMALTIEQKQDLWNRWDVAKKFLTAPGDFGMEDAIELTNAIFETKES